MSATEVASLVGSYTADPDHSSFGFAVRHMTVSTFRGSFSDVSASVVVAETGELRLSGAARVESIAVPSPVDLRTHLLSEDFFNADRHPQITFESESAQLADDGTVTVAGRLTMRNVTRAVTATGTWSSPVEDPYGNTRAALELTATVDRREYGMTWNLPLPKGGDALGTEVVITAHLELIAD